MQRCESKPDCFCFSCCWVKTFCCYLDKYYIYLRYLSTVVSNSEYQFCCLTKPSSSWQIIIRSSVIDSAVFQQGLDSMLFNHAVVVWSVLMYNTMVHIILTPSILVSLTLVITIHWMCDTQLKWGQGYGIKRHFQQYFSYIVAVRFIGGGNQSTQRKPPTCHKSLKTFIT